MSWVCPSCVTVWPEKPFVDGTIGCPECGSISASNLVAIVRAGVERNGEAGTVVPLARDAVDKLVARLSAAEQERNALRDDWRRRSLQNDLAAAEARAEAAERKLAECEQERDALEMDR